MIDRHFWKGSLLGAALAGALVFVLALLCSGCGATAMTRYYQSDAQAFATAATCYRVASKFNIEREGEILATAKIDKDKARADRAEWRPKYAQIRKACDGLAIAAEEAEAAADGVEAATSRDADAIKWVVRLVALMADTARILGEYGIKLPGVQ